MKKFILIVSAIITISTLGFSQWIYQNSGVSTNLYEIFFLDEVNGWSVGANGVILMTTNGGTNWNIIPSGTNVSLSDILFFNPNNGMLIGDNGTIKKSTDGGLNWFDINSGVSLRLQRFSFIDSNNGWICGDGGLILKTTDGGDTWNIQATLPAYYLLDIWFNDVNTGWVCTSFNGEIWKTTDGGNNWSYKYETPSNERLHRIQFVNDIEGWAVGEWGLILKSTDGGESWFEQNSGTGEAMFGLFFTDNLHGFAVGKGENILRTTDGGNNWILYRSGPAFELYAVYFLDQNIGWATGSSGTILFTENSGIPVELVSFTAAQSNDQIHLSWITATELNNQGFEIERTTTDDWEKIGFVNGNGTTTEIQYYSFIDENVPSGKYRYRLKQVDFDGTFEYSEIIEVVVGTPTEFSLGQNYPNPFNPSTTIKYQIPELSFVTLKVYDVLGNEIVTLVNEEEPAGEYEVEFSSSGGANDLSSGIYFYQIKAGSYIETKKMILLR